MLTLYGRPDSYNVQIVAWTAAELGVETKRLDYGHRFGGTDTPEFLAMNPMGYVPVVRDGDGDGDPMSEAAAIMRYLAAKYSKGDAFWPADPARRAPVDRWAEWAKNEAADAFLQPIFWLVVRTKPGEPIDAAAFQSAMAKLETRLHIAEARLKRHTYLAGEAFTAADIPFGGFLFRYFTLDIKRPDLPALKAYYDRLATRPAYRNHVMISYDELRAS